MKKIVLILALLLPFIGQSQEKISLKDCFSILEKNYPLAVQADLLAQQNKIDLELLNKEKLPKLHFSAQATYQSAVTKIPIPNSSVRPLDKDQYRALLSVQQLIVGNGKISEQQALKRLISDRKQRELDVKIHKQKSFATELFYSILLLQEQMALLASKKNLLTVKHQEIQSKIANGTVLISSDKIIAVELLKVDQKMNAISLEKLAYISSLSTLIGLEIATNTKFEDINLPQMKTTSLRPELDVFKLRSEEILIKSNVLSKSSKPTITGFINGGYGNPGLNMLDNSFQSFYTMGVQLNWNIFNWQNTKNKKASLAINKNIIETEKAVFDLSTQIELNQLQSEIDKLEEFINSDKEIIAMRREILETTSSQLLHGLITSSVYITELSNLFEEENTLKTHQIKRSLAKANYALILGR